MRCVVLTSPDDRGTSDLVRLLRARGVEVVFAGDPPSVMVELASSPRGALIVDKPADRPRLAQLFAAVRKYYPAVVCRQYDPPGPDGQRRLAPPGGADRSGRQPEAGTKPKSDEPWSPQAPINHDEACSGQQSGGGKTPSPLVSREELAILLGEHRTRREDGKKNAPKEEP